MSIRRFGKRSKSSTVNSELDFSQRFLLEACYRFARNFLRNYHGHLEDEDFFDPISQRIPPAILKRIFTQCTTKAQARAMLNLKKDDEIDISGEDPNELLLKLWEHPYSNPRLREKLVPWLDAQILLLDSSLCEHPAKDAERFNELQRVFRLSPLESELLLQRRLAYGLWDCRTFSGELSYGKFNRIACALGISDGELQEISNQDSRLRKLDCLEKNLDFNRHLLPYVSGADTVPLEDNYFTTFSGETLPWEFFGDIAEKDGRNLVALLNDRSRKTPLHILLYGTPGTGKTSFAAALAKRTGRTAYFINIERCNRLSALQVCALQHDDDQSLIVMDEADDVINCWDRNIFGPHLNTFKKGELNTALDNINVPCVWIANSRPDSLDESNRRRFDYSIEFQPFTTESRSFIWQNAARRHAIVLSADEIATVAEKYPISAGGIELALRNMSAMEGKDSLERIDKILTPHCRLMGREARRELGVSSNYSLDALNLKTDLPLEEIVSAVENFLLGEQDDPDRPRMNLLLSGPPGTGKTEFVRFLGKRLNIPVITRMGSDILSKWVGGTEENIRNAFRAAENDHGILFFDEIDGLMQSREHARHSWEVSQVNELLQNMEDFNGVMVGATNFLRSLDSAILRRFTFKLEFDYLDNRGKRIFFQRFFQTELSENESKRLDGIAQLTPGDFRTVRQGLFYRHTAQDNTIRLDALEHESTMKRESTEKHRIGFA